MSEAKKDTVPTEEQKELAVKEQAALASIPEVPMGFEDEEAGDMIIPRVKVIQTLSPEKKDKSAVTLTDGTQRAADEGDIINSLTLERLNGKVFVPVFKFPNNIDWRDRSEGGGILCIARDGKIGIKSDGTQLMCASCKRCEFDNTKQGKEALPKCTKYINYFGFFKNERMPIILSFAKTNYNEGKKMYSLAKVTMQNMWNHGYTLTEKLQSKNGNEWYIIIPAPSGATSDEDREFGMNLYKMYRDTIKTVSYDMDDNSTEASTPSVDAESAEY